MSDVSKARKKALKAVEADLSNLGCRPTGVDVVKPSRGLGDRLLTTLWSPGFGDPVEVLRVSATLHDCMIEIAIPIAKWGFTPPYLVQIDLPVPINGRAEYRRGRLGTRWHVEPDDKNHVADLKRVMPGVKMKDKVTSKKIPVQTVYEVEVGHSLERAGGGTTWLVHTAPEGGVVSSPRPKVAKYLEAIPAVRKMLESWND